MNSHDRKNLEFLLTADEKILRTWLKGSTQDDQEYAWELLAAYSEELSREALDLRVEAELDSLEEFYPEALTVINQIQGLMK